MDCKRALAGERGDIEAAVKLLREKGMAQAAKRAGRETTEGIVGYRASTTRSGTMVAVGCETEPVSKNEEFRAFAQAACSRRSTQRAPTRSTARGGAAGAVAKLGENIVVVGRRALRGGRRRDRRGYVHPPANKLGVLVQVRGGTDGARAQARDAHRRRRARVDRPRGRSRGRSSTPSARSTRTPTRCSRSPSRRVRRSSKGC